MEMKGFVFNQQQQQQVVEENMSNLTSASGEASASSGNRTEIGTNYLAPPPTQTQPAKKKRNLPGNPGLFSCIPYSKSKPHFFWLWLIHDT